MINDPEVMIEARQLSQFYGDFAAIRDVSFSIRQGQVAAFLGPNGAGKSTTLRILTGYARPSRGAAVYRRPGYGGIPAAIRTENRVSARKRATLSGDDPT